MKNMCSSLSYLLHPGGYHLFPLVIQMSSLLFRNLVGQTLLWLHKRLQLGTLSMLRILLCMNPQTVYSPDAIADATSCRAGSTAFSFPFRRLRHVTTQTSACVQLSGSLVSGLCFWNPEGSSPFSEAGDIIHLKSSKVYSWPNIPLCSSPSPPTIKPLQCAVVCAERMYSMMESSKFT